MTKKTEIKGIDVSYHQGKIDFEKVKKAGFEFVIIRAGYGKRSAQKDKNFDLYYNAARRAGLKVGAYWYSYAKSAQDAASEAQRALAALEGKSLDLPLFYDIEERFQLMRGKSFVAKIAKIFCAGVKAKYTPGIYMSEYYLERLLDEKAAGAAKLWAAHYGKPYGGRFGILMQQTSSSGSVPGIKGGVDLDTLFYPFNTITPVKKAQKKTAAKGAENKKGKSENKKKGEPGASGGKVYYTIKKGDNLTKIAKKFGTTVDALARLNGIKNKNLIYAGGKIRVK